MIRIFEDLPVDAGFTCKPADGKVYRADLLKKAPVVRLSLVHGASVAVIRSIDPAGAPGFRADMDEDFLDVYDADGAVTDLPGVYLTTTHGDCVPIWVCDPVKGAVGLAHAGWRGTLAGIAGSLVRTMAAAYGSDPADLRAVIGPGIGACCFEVGPDVAEAFTDRFYWAEDYVYAYPDARPHVDLKGVNAELLALEGVTRIAISPRCTCCEPDLFWSHRRCGDKTRMLAFIGKRKE